MNEQRALVPGGRVVEFYAETNGARTWPHSIFMAEVADRALRFLRHETWAVATRVDMSAIPGNILASYSSGTEQSALIDDGTTLTLAAVSGGRATFDIAATAHWLTWDRVTDLHRYVPPETIGENNEVPLTFWTLGQYGPVSRNRRIGVASWQEIAGNYARDTRDALVRLMDPEFRPGHGGQLLLWHGRPGTGKTHALRALVWEWRTWCGAEYIVDPEKFFGESAEYLAEVLLGQDEERHGRWRLLIFEDTGELLSADASQRSGQGLSRLLNVVDGLVGQGLKVLVLVTTNEEIGRLHDAVSRPGRAATNVTFDLLAADEALLWLTAHDVPASPAKTGRMSLADLYARLEGFQQTGTPGVKVGFGRG